MADREQLNSVFKDLVRDNTDQANVTLHSYMATKAREVLGFGSENSENLTDPEDGTGSSDEE